MDKHLVAHNKMSGKSDLSVIRTITPVAIFKVKSDNSLSVHYCEKCSEEKLLKITKDAWFWYMAYMKWEDKQIDL